MIRWYDVVLAVLAADALLSFTMWGLTSTVWWEPIAHGFAVGVIWHSWNSAYCSYRARQEAQQ